VGLDRRLIHRDSSITTTTNRDGRLPRRRPSSYPDLVTDRTSTSGHRRTRRDHASEVAEDYCEAIAELADAAGDCRVVDLAGRFGVSHVTVVRTVKRLERDGLVSTEPYRPVRLTAKGRRLANTCRERHDVVYRFLLAIGVDPRTAAVDAEGLEHHVSPATLARFRAIAEGDRPPAPPRPPAAT
jgi:DtxR family manganese transport transcriptional regulator